MECARELEKIENSGLLGVVQEYKDKLVTSRQEGEHNQHKKFTTKLGEYHKYMQEYYGLH